MATTIEKALATRQDFLIGLTPTTQIRGGATVNVDPIGLEWLLSSVADLIALPVEYTHARIVQGAVLGSFAYDAASTAVADGTTVITPAHGVGRWLLQAVASGGGGVSAWVGGNAYAVGDVVEYQGSLWSTTTANTDAAFTAANWANISNATSRFAVTDAPATGYSATSAYEWLEVTATNTVDAPVQIFAPLNASVSAKNLRVILVNNSLTNTASDFNFQPSFVDAAGNAVGLVSVPAGESATLEFKLNNATTNTWGFNSSSTYKQPVGDVIRVAPSVAGVTVYDFDAAPAALDTHQYLLAGSAGTRLNLAPSMSATSEFTVQDDQASRTVLELYADHFTRVYHRKLVNTFLQTWGAWAVEVQHFTVASLAATLPTHPVGGDTLYDQASGIKYTYVIEPLASFWKAV